MAEQEITSCEFKISLEDFKKLSPGEQNVLIYSCLIDLQDKIRFKGKLVVGLSAASGLIGGFFHDLLFMKGVIK